MIYKCVRTYYPDKCTISGLYIADSFVYYILEDVDRKLELEGIKIPKETAIPRGKYQLIIDKSNRFQRDMPHILDVPQFDGIRIHWGNTDLDTEGCPIIGLTWPFPITKPNFIGESRKAFDIFFAKLQETLRTEDVWWEVI